MNVSITYLIENRKLITEVRELDEECGDPLQGRVLLRNEVEASRALWTLRYVVGELEKYIAFRGCIMLGEIERPEKTEKEVSSPDLMPPAEALANFWKAGPWEGGTEKEKAHEATVQGLQETIKALRDELVSAYKLLAARETIAASKQREEQGYENTLQALWATVKAMRQELQAEKAEALRVITERGEGQDNG